MLAVPSSGFSTALQAAAQQNPLAALSGRRGLASSPRDAAAFEDEALELLRAVKVEDGDQDVVTAGMVRDLRVDPESGILRFSLTTNSNEVRAACENRLMGEQERPAWLRRAPVITVRPNSRGSARVSSGRGIEGVKRIVAVSSGKGGVGKSTVAVNLAFALSENHAVGLLDADVYGPSLPTMMVEPGAEWAVRQTPDGRLMEPVQFHGIKCMSYGFVAPGTGGRGRGVDPKNAFAQLAASARSGTGAAAMRGPMVSNVITQLATQTDWGDLDVLVIDMPPGTGDIHITLGQQLKIDGTVIVTTPQLLSFVDVIKGLELYQKLDVPTIGVVENMAYFDGDDGKRYMPFGPGHRDELVAGLGIQNAVTLPILANASACADSGTPFTRAHLDSEVAQTYRKLAEGVMAEITARSQPDAIKSSTLKYNADNNMIVARFIMSNGAAEYRIPPLELRRRLRRVDDMLGKDAKDLDENLHPVSIENMGNYAASIVWSDGHDASIYPFQDVREACKEFEQTP
ncbi:Cytosolic Fe-S cluster assembly factor NUBP1-like [Hondaea fermentalgiana]|uniref:Cytosolic Fe-S cluster assembly factor NUBP1-like n=1 Tax=Hondaea fermentalgiana TaxID=2315210 RepID=A0A2R5GV95_9STRA|nr:Cytosolic Fe-S cluster assembly factor NUBP1-like [Hondaea fermentalgiana]|eukprot:GBG34485.1 Cytosolic Fe-S cluster assembly factor NUBP1-like [Hondaea fermentalgiana]